MSETRERCDLVAGAQGPERDAARFWAQVDKRGTEDCWLWAGATSHRYGVIGLKIGDKWRTRRVHRVSFEMANGPIPDGLVIDHLCHVKNCVNPAHLRATTQQQNTWNRQGAQSNSKSGVRGVYWEPAARRWKVMVGYNGKQRYGGNFVSLEEAAVAAEALRQKLYMGTATIAAA